ncbi:MAG TPA: helix-turn-helix transcriptional regulator [Anaerolineales bacterium]|nr:helix-turn-helix transcriptional regulator [Anaerolineales bacterium]
MAQFNPLSNREQEVVKLLLQGKSNKLIAAALGISERTVEFHLKNIYAKFQVSSRIELVLKLGNATGTFEIEKLGDSTVARPGESAENRDKLNSRTDWATSSKATVSMTGKELEMKNFLNTKHVLVGVVTALLTGLLWVVLLRRFGHMSLDDIRTWMAPLIVILAMIGSSVGLIGKRHGNTLLKVCFSTLFGTGLSPIAILPLMGMVVLPLGKLADRIGFIDRTTMPMEVATTLAITAMLAIWLVLGIAAGSLLLSVTIGKPEQRVSQTPAPERRL